MAEPIPFVGVTHDYGPPPGYDEMIGRLMVFKNGATVVSAWRLSPAELEAVVNSGGVVFVSVMSGDSVYPMFVGCESTVKTVAADTGKVWE